MREHGYCRRRVGVGNACYLRHTSRRIHYVPACRGMPGRRSMCRNERSGNLWGFGQKEESYRETSTDLLTLNHPQPQATLKRRLPPPHACHAAERSYVHKS